MIIMKKLLIISFCLVLFGCGQTTETYTADYLFENKDIRNQVLADCKENNQSSENCVNAEAAKAKRFNETSVDKNVQQF